MKFASPAFSRAVAGAAAFLLLAALFGRPDVLAFAIVLTAWAVVSSAQRPLWAHRPATPPAGNAVDDGNNADAVKIRVTKERISEGDAFAVELVGTDPQAILTTGIGTVERASLSPRWAMVSDVGATHTTVEPHAWGRYRLYPVVAHSSDPLGGFVTSTVLPEIPFHVLPLPSRFASPPTLAEVLGVSGPHLSRRKGDGTAFADIRAFRPGDRLKRVNWRVSSRTRDLHVNEAFTERDTDVMIVTDTATDLLPVGAPENAPGSSLDICIRALTGICHHYVSEGDRVAVHDLGNRIGSLHFATGTRQWRRVIEQISLVNRADHDARANRALPRVRPGTLAYVLSPLLSDTVIEDIGTLRGYGAHVTVIDTLPKGLGDISDLTGKPQRMIEGVPDQRFYDEAWVATVQQRRITIRECERSGVHVSPWRGGQP